MSIFDIFGTSAQQNAANAQIAGIQSGQQQATQNINAGTNALQTNFGAALQPFQQNLTTANAGVTQLGNVLGLNGARGNATAQQALNNTPGYQFAQQQGQAAVNAGEAASGMTNSGNQQLALQQQGQGLASQNYNNYVSQLQPYLSASQNAASGIAGVDTGLGTAVAGQDNSLANLNFSAATGIGNANANAALAPLTAGANVFGLLGSLGSAALGGAAKSGSLFGGSAGPTSVGGAPLSGGNIFGSLFSPSDKRLKEGIEQVGKLDDGLPVYKYRYIGSPVWQIGLMAQDVEKVTPEAVADIGGGYKGVDYNKATAYAADLSRFLEAA
jgi:Chaperone of endosialidase